MAENGQRTLQTTDVTLDSSTLPYLDVMSRRRESNIDFPLPSINPFAAPANGMNAFAVSANSPNPFVVPTNRREEGPETFLDNAYSRHVKSRHGHRTGMARGAESDGVFNMPAPLHSTGHPGLYEYNDGSPEVPLQAVQSRLSPVPVQSALSTEVRAGTELLHTLVDKFTDAIQKNTASKSKVDMRPPHFDGTSDVNMFIQQFEEVAKLCGWNDRIALVQLRGCLEKNAKDCGGADTITDIYQQLLSIYGMSSAEARERLHSVTRESGESYSRLGNRVQRLTKLAYRGLGQEVEMQMALDYFNRALTEPALRQHLLAISPISLGAAITAAENYRLVGRQSIGATKATAPNRVAPVDAVPTSSRGSADCSTLEKMMKLIESLNKKLDLQGEQIRQQNMRLASYEQQPKHNFIPNNRRNDQGCWRCGDPSHFRRECPRIAARGQDVRYTPKANNSEN